MQRVNHSADKNSAESTLEFFFLRLSYWLETSRKVLLLIKPATNPPINLKLLISRGYIVGLYYVLILTQVSFWFLKVSALKELGKT